MNLKFTHKAVVEFPDFIEVMENVLGMTYCNKGYWNAPKDRSSFDIELPTPSNDSQVYCGESKWLWMGYINRPGKNQKAEIKLYPTTEHHFTITFADCLVLLQHANIMVVDEFYIIHFSW